MLGCEPVVEVVGEGAEPDVGGDPVVEVVLEDEEELLEVEVEVGLVVAFTVP